MWWNKKLNQWFSVCIEHPLKTWKKAKKYFKKPKTTIHFFSNPIYNCPYASYNYIAKIIDIRVFDIGWKDKFSTPRHERSPYVWICFFKRFGFSINWHIYYYNEFGEKQCGDIYYWEYLLDYIYYNKNLTHYPCWVSDSRLYKYMTNYKEKTMKAIEYAVPVVAMSLNKLGIKELKSLKKL